MANPTSFQDLTVDRNFQIPNSLLNEAFGELNLTRRQNSIDVVLTVLVDPSAGAAGEGWQTGVALDGSSSMQGPFGVSYEWTRQITAQEMDSFVNSGLGSREVVDGQSVISFTEDGMTEMRRLGLLKPCQNEVQEVAQNAIPYLAEKLDEDGGTTVIYWACGAGGSGIEVVGDLSASEAKQAGYSGPKSWGDGTRLMPAIRYFLDRFKDAKMGFYVFVTDGEIEDFEDVKNFTAQLSRDVSEGTVNDVKLVLIGVGDQINRTQMEELDDLPDELDLPVDIWDHKIASEIRGITDLFAELVDENLTLAPSGRVLDDSNQTIVSFTDGVPALMKFSLPLSATSFTLEISGGGSITQDLYG
ncbi:MAG: VWA domain-containing protein [Verrucomicrobiae bacterium]|nr:VWA domain-containing protein [Verrucomicrobiae bacterium]